MSREADKSRAEEHQRDADWYDQFYKSRQLKMPPWYRFLAPELQKALNPGTKLIELGCGQGHLLRALAAGGSVPEQNITGVDQSKTAVDFCSREMPGGNFLVADIYELKEIPDQKFDICLLMETIEHFENPEKPLASIFRIMKPGGFLYVSFPNYLHFPWLVVRILAEKLNHPNWIVLQPVDKIYTVFGVTRLLARAGFRFVKAVGSSYGPPVLFPLETDGLTRLLNKLGLWRLSFHPILVFERLDR